MGQHQLLVLRSATALIRINHLMPNFWTQFQIRQKQKQTPPSSVMDPFKTTPPRFSTPLPNPMEDLIRISKRQLLNLFQSIDFEEIVIPRHSATENTDDTRWFVETVGKAFVSMLVEHYPKKTSPKKLLNLSDHAPLPET